MKKIIFVRHGESTENLANKKGEKYDESKIVLTKDGIKQVKVTGKYLHKTFGKFDKIYCSPVHRCRQTYDIISEEIKSSNKDLIIDDLIIELGAYKNIYNGMTEAEINNIHGKNKDLTNLIHELDKTIDPYEKYELKMKQLKLLEKMHKDDVIPNLTDITNNCSKFLRNLKNTKYNKILVITHGGIIDVIQRLVCNLENKIIMNFYISTKTFNDTDELKGNCCCLCIGLENNKYKLIMPSNTYHLIKN